MIDFKKKPENQYVANLQVRDPRNHKNSDGNKHLVEPLNPIDANEWGLERIFKLPSSKAGWVGFTTRGGAVWIGVIKALEIAAFEAQVATGLGVFTFVLTTFAVWKLSPKLRPNIIGIFSPLVFLTLVVFAGEYIDIENKYRVNDKPPTEQIVTDSEGVG